MKSEVKTSTDLSDLVDMPILSTMYWISYFMTALMIIRKTVMM